MWHQASLQAPEDGFMIQSNCVCVCVCVCVCYECAGEHILLLLEGSALPGPKSGLLCNTRKWIVLGDTRAAKQETILGRGAPGIELQWWWCSVAKFCLSFETPMDCSTPGVPVLHHLPEFAQTHVHWVGDAIQPSYPLSSPSPPTINLSELQCLFQWVSSWHQGAKVLELHLQHQSFQWAGVLVDSPKRTALPCSSQSWVLW